MKSRKVIAFSQRKFIVPNRIKHITGTEYGFGLNLLNSPNTFNSILKYIKEENK